LRRRIKTHIIRYSWLFCQSGHTFLLHYTLRTGQVLITSGSDTSKCGALTQTRRLSAALHVRRPGQLACSERGSERLRSDVRIGRRRVRVINIDINSKELRTSGRARSCPRARKLPESLLSPQEPLTAPYPEPDKTNPQLYVLWKN
jgi:hypothetical protein